MGMRTGIQSRDCQRMELASHLVEMGSTRDIIGCDETCDEGNEDDIDVEDDPTQKRYENKCIFIVSNGTVDK